MGPEEEPDFKPSNTVALPAKKPPIKYGALTLPEDWEEMHPEEQGTFMHKAENAFEKDLDDVGLMIVPAGGDGNCLFRAIAFQAYGDQKWH